jgi:hypothetical protein
MVVSCVQERVADLGDPGPPVALPDATIPLMCPRHWRRQVPCSLRVSTGQLAALAASALCREEGTRVPRKLTAQCAA